MNISNVQAAEAAQTSSRSAQAATSATQIPSPVSKSYYFSPALIIDPKLQAVVFEFRNGQTGEVTAEYPSHPVEKAVAAYTQQAPVVAAAPPQQKISDSTSTSSSSTASVATGASPQKTSTTASILA